MKHPDAGEKYAKNHCPFSNGKTGKFQQVTENADWAIIVMRTSRAMIFKRAGRLAAFASLFPTP
jgi:archaeosine-15-forming tRNA-guanine transglycosylase